LYCRIMENSHVSVDITKLVTLASLVSPKVKELSRVKLIFIFSFCYLEGEVKYGQVFTGVVF
jgi:hypothetical protein